MPEIASQRSKWAEIGAPRVKMTRGVRFRPPKGQWRPKKGQKGSKRGFEKSCFPPVFPPWCMAAFFSSPGPVGSRAATWTQGGAIPKAPGGKPCRPLSGLGPANPGPRIREVKELPRAPGPGPGLRAPGPGPRLRAPGLRTTVPRTDLAEDLSSNGLSGDDDHDHGRGDAHDHARAAARAYRSGIHSDHPI